MATRLFSVKIERVNDNLITQEQFKIYGQEGPLILAIDNEILLPKNAPVQLTCAQLEGLYYTKLYRAYSTRGRKSKIAPRVLVKVMVYGYQCGIYSSRTSEEGLVVYHSDDLDRHVMESDGLKNKFRCRSIPDVDDDLWDRLCELPKIITVGNKDILTEQLFHSPEGKPYNPNNWVNRVYRPFMKALHQAHPDIPELSPHECRHTRATLWIAQGIDPYMVARLLGHNGVSMLARRYDHTSIDTPRNVLLATKGKETAPS